MVDGVLQMHLSVMRGGAMAVAENTGTPAVNYPVLKSTHILIFSTDWIHQDILKTQPDKIQKLKLSATGKSLCGFCQSHDLYIIVCI